MAPHSKIGREVVSYDTCIKILYILLTTYFKHFNTNQTFQPLSYTEYCSVRLYYNNYKNALILWALLPKCAVEMRRRRTRVWGCGQVSWWTGKGGGGFEKVGNHWSKLHGAWMDCIWTSFVSGVWTPATYNSYIIL